MRKLVSVVFSLTFLGSLLLNTSLNGHAQDDESANATPKIDRCVNMGNALEAPNEGDWGILIEEQYFNDIADVGFDTVRIPIRWSAHAATEAPYTIDDAFFARVDEVVDWSLGAGLTTIINIHHFNPIMEAPAANEARLFALWTQIATHYADYPETLIFELLNEPNNAMTADIWNDMQLRLIDHVRAIDAERTLIIGGHDWNSINGLEALQLPENTDNLIATFHNYEPFQFTHQGATWVDGALRWLGTGWGEAEDLENLEAYFARIAAWQSEYRLPLLMGEFGAYSEADFDARVVWTTATREAAQSLSVAWCYWEFGSGFGIYIPGINRWNRPLLNALIPEAQP